MRVKITKSSEASYWYADKVGEIFETDGKVEYDSYCAIALSTERDRYFIGLDDCVVISENETEGGGTMIIDGVKYREVNRKAAVGERVLVCNDDTVPFAHEGSSGVVSNISDEDVYAVFDHGKYDDYNDSTWYLNHEDYVVLEPIGHATEPTEDDSYASDDAALIVLQRKVNELTRQLDGLTGTVAKLAEKVTKDERKVTFDKPEKAPLTRDEIVAKAAADVAELERIGKDVTASLPIESPLYNSFYNVKFEVNREKRTVVALISLKYGSGHVRYRGIAKAAPGDVFNEILGRAIALRRALGLPVPIDYVNCPKPEGVRVGDVVTKKTGVYGGASGTVIAIRPRGYMNDDEGLTFLSDANGKTIWTFIKWADVIDDSARYDASGKAAE